MKIIHVLCIAERETGRRRGKVIISLFVTTTFPLTMLMTMSLTTLLQKELQDVICHFAVIMFIPFPYSCASWYMLMCAREFAKMGCGICILCGFYYFLTKSFWLYTFSSLFSGFCFLMPRIYTETHIAFQLAGVVSGINAYLHTSLLKYRAVCTLTRHHVTRHYHVVFLMTIK